MLLSDMQSKPFHVKYSAGLTHGKTTCQGQGKSILPFIRNHTLGTSILWVFISRSVMWRE